MSKESKEKLKKETEEKNITLKIYCYIAEIHYAFYFK